MNKQGTADPTSQGMNEKVEQIKESVKGVVEQGAQKVDQLKSRVIEVKDQAMSRGSDMLDRTCDLIKAHPIKSVAIAFAAGYFGMRLFR